MDFKSLVDIYFYKKKDWSSVTDQDKDSLFFIFNRYMAKKYPKQAQFFNDKSIDKVTAMNVWFTFLKSEVRVPLWFWKGPTKRKDPPVKDWQIVRDFWELNLNDIYLLCEIFPEDVKEEIKRIELINKETTK